MKKFLGIMVGFLLCVMPLMASTKGYDQLLGVLTPSSVILDLDSYEIETYEVSDMSYVPVFRLKDAGCNVLYDSVSRELKITTNPTSSPTHLEIPDLSQKPFSLYEGNIWIGNFKTHGIISEGRVLIPIGALRQLWQIEISENHYKLLPKEEISILATQTQIENKMAVPTSLSLVDIYWEDKWVTVAEDYTLAPSEVLIREPLPTSETKIYLSTIITNVQNELLSYTNQNMYGQLNEGLFTRFSRARNGQNLSDLGDPIDMASVIWAEDTVNAKNLHSTTPYLVWTNIASQKTYIFEGSQGNWQLIKHFVCSTGRDHTPTPKGEFQLTRKVPYFGVEKGYRCKNAFGFIGTTYLYHSIIFDKTGSYLLEKKGVLGTKASEGCIRFSVENSEWFYNNMVSGTKVWIN
ncbi:MAG: L,D-transpeptidase [Niameybacter sp.]